jgi:hypothetical protein
MIYYIGLDRRPRLPMCLMPVQGGPEAAYQHSYPQHRVVVGPTTHRVDNLKIPKSEKQLERGRASRFDGQARRVPSQRCR